MCYVVNYTFMRKIIPLAMKILHILFEIVKKITVKSLGFFNPEH